MTLERYEWHSIREQSGKRVSCWDRAEKCHACGADIVHVYTLSDGNSYGAECAWALLGHKNASETRAHGKSWRERDILSRRELAYKRDRIARQLAQLPPLAPHCVCGNASAHSDECGGFFI
jgi:hypothetical protein